MADFTLSRQPPTVAEFIDLRARVGWGAISEATAAQSLQAPAFTISLRRDGQLLGFARVIGDGTLFLFLTELIVDPSCRGEGLGETLMQEVTRYFDRTAVPGATVTLVALRDRESFYERFGFVRCPDGLFGAGMHYAPVLPR
jgi:predicted GNAT family N-acyltransferase